MVSFEPVSYLQRFTSEEHLPFAILSDPERRAYRAFGLQEGTVGRIFGPATLWAYVSGILRGRWPRVPRSDDRQFRQLGGDVIINAGGKVVLLYRSKNPADRPAVGTLLDAIRRSVK